MMYCRKRSVAVQFSFEAWCKWWSY